MTSLCSPLPLVYTVSKLRPVLCTHVKYSERILADTRNFMYPCPLTCPPFSMLCKLTCKIMTFIWKVIVCDLGSMVKTQAGDTLEANCSPISYFSPKGLDLIASVTIQKLKEIFFHISLKFLTLTSRSRPGCGWCCLKLKNFMYHRYQHKKIKGRTTCTQILMCVQLDAVCIDFISYSKTCVKRPLKNRQKPDLNDKC